MMAAAVHAAAGSFKIVFFFAAPSDIAFTSLSLLYALSSCLPLFSPLFFRFEFFAACF